MKPSVVVVGSFVKDLSFRCGRFPTAGETVIGTFTTGPGGKGSNQAVACARAGARTRFVGAVGRDAFGAEAARFLRSEGIDARLAPKRGQATGAAAILVDGSSQNEIIVAIGASVALGSAAFAAAEDGLGSDEGAGAAVGLASGKNDALEPVAVSATKRNAATIA